MNYEYAKRIAALEEKVEILACFIIAHLSDHNGFPTGRGLVPYLRELETGEKSSAWFEQLSALRSRAGREGGLKP